MSRAMMETRSFRAVQPLRRTAPMAVLCDITNTSISNNPAPEVAKERMPSAGICCPPKSVLLFGESLCRTTTTSTTASTPLMHDPLDLDDDAFGTDDPQSVAEYAADIYSNLGREEVNYLPRPEYMESQMDINAKMRAILIDWLVEVHMKYKLKTETLFLTVNLIDRFLEKRQLTRKKLQLVGVTSMLIAAKFEEIYPPEVRDFVYITDNAYSKDDILKMEVTMLTALKFVLCRPTVAHFLERYQGLNHCAEAHHHLMQYVLELTLPDIKMIRYAPSHLAAAAALLSNKLLKQHPAWPAPMIRHTNQTEPMVKGCAREMCSLLEAAERSPLQAVRKKFSQARFSSVAKIVF